MAKNDKDLVPRGHLVEEVTLDFGEGLMTGEDIMNTEEKFQQVLDDAREGTLSALFMVTINKDDMSYTYFSGKDGEEQTSGLLAMAAIYAWLIGQGIMLSPEEMVVIGRQMRGEDGSI